MNALVQVLNQISRPIQLMEVGLTAADVFLEQGNIPEAVKALKTTEELLLVLKEFVAEINTKLVISNEAFVMAFDRIEKVINNSKLDWKDKFSFVFAIAKETDMYSHPLYNDYCDPDSGYEDDTLAFYNYLKEIVEKVKSLL